jgi:hypothetical protein
MNPRSCAALLTALAICGCATTSPPRTANNTAAPSCLTDTGSRIPPSPDTACLATGRSYSQTDLDRTGKSTVAGALRDLDPSLTISH